MCVAQGRLRSLKPPRKADLVGCVLLGLQTFSDHLADPPMGYVNLGVCERSGPGAEGLKFMPVASGCELIALNTLFAAKGLDFIRDPVLSTPAIISPLMSVRMTMKTKDFTSPWWTGTLPPPTDPNLLKQTTYSH